ncbi:hypothetical protein BU25DRAFT_406706 [Macroventuria anomochaeta]|uniref:Uncharacterized protein n=1 Tax=Macroventuria anomochaeta TaxID=301207 RepID=A0ACB6SCZ9_9PLEO|nr:uncharacterized protein BU25DRAFT_406706 [Macroventuria anomochaeta]KAF2632175.1 hypothetical protein BU25DRAFT_406706 [Macroventuria anomochaeta]
MSSGENVRATGPLAGTFRDYLLAMRRHRKRPQRAAIHLRCIMTGGQLPRGRVSGSESMCKAGTFPCHRYANGEIEAWGFSDGAFIPERRQLVCSSASIRPCDVLSRVGRCPNLVIHRAPRRYKEGRTCRTYSRLRECRANSFVIDVHCRAVGL